MAKPSALQNVIEYSKNTKGTLKGALAPTQGANYIVHFVSGDFNLQSKQLQDILRSMSQAKM
jgi:hypothetical protein